MTRMRLAGDLSDAQVALYARVSTEEQAEQYGLDAQLRALRQQAAERGAMDPAEYVDDGVSGATLDRPALTRLRASIRDRGVDVVLIHDPDRLARDLTFALLLEKEFREGGARVEYLTVRTDDTPAGALQRQILGAIAEFERHKIKERTARGRMEKARRGLIPSGPCPFGYRRDDTAPGGIAPDPDAAEVVRRMFAWVLEGVSLRTIVERLNAQQLRPARGGIWRGSSVRRILRAEIYTGTAHYNRRHYPTPQRAVFKPTEEWVSIAVPAIIAQTVFDRVQAQLDRNRAILVGRPAGFTYLLKGLVRCGGCGLAYAGCATHGKPYYRCTGRPRLAGVIRCRAPMQQARRLEQAVWDAVCSVLRDPDQLLTTVKQYRSDLDARRVDAQAEAGELTKALARVRKQRERLLQLYLDTGISKATFTERDSRLASEETSVTQRLRAAEAAVASGTAEATRHAAALRYCQLVRRGLDRLDDDGKQRLLRLLVDKVVITGDRIEVHGIVPTHTDGPPGRVDYRTESPETRNDTRPLRYVVRVLASG